MYTAIAMTNHVRHPPGTPRGAKEDSARIPVTSPVPRGVPKKVWYLLDSESLDTSHEGGAKEDSVRSGLLSHTNDSGPPK